MASKHHRSIVSVLLLAVLLIAAVGLSLGSATAGATPQNVGDRFYQTDSGPTAANNTTVPHENPASVDRKGNLSELQGWLAGRLSQSLINCSEGIQVGQYDACNQSEGTYPDFLSKYVNVTRKSDSGTNKTASFERTAENQSEYASDVRRFRTTVEKYREARQNGSTQKARRLARRAQRLARQVNETSGQLTQGYQTIANGTGQNFTAAINTTRSVTQNVSTTAESLSIEQFLNTTITATARSQEISFRDPLRVTGRIAAANGTPLANRTVQLQAGNQSRRTTTNASGVYSFTYRPTMVSLDTQRVTLRYLPTNLSVYRSNRTAVPVQIQQVQPTIEMTGESGEVRFGEVVNVNGRVAVNNTSVSSIPVAVSIDGQALTFTGGERARTTSSGLFRIAARLPMQVSTGQQAVRVSLPFENRALGRTNASIPVTVVPTQTALSINATQISVNGSDVNGPVVRVAGRLTTKDGRPIRDQPVTLSVNGTTTVEATTGDDGRYTANVTVPKQVFADRSGTLPASIGAAYAGSGTNLASAHARTSIQLTLPTEPATFFETLFGVFEEIPWIYGLVGGVGLLLVASYGVYRYRGRSTQSRSEASATETSVSSDSNDPVDDTPDRDSLLKTAREQLSSGDPATAVTAAYAAVRTGLQRDLDLTSAYTHWEFLDACLNHDLDDHRANALQQLTELYERAAFSQHSLSETMATTALDDADTVTDTEQRAATEDSTADSNSWQSE